MRLKSSILKYSILVLAICAMLEFSGCSKQQDQAQQAAQDANAAPGSEDKAGGSAHTSKGVLKGLFQPTVVPTGTALVIRLGSTLSSKTSQAGEAFDGTLADAISVDGKEAIPAGAKVTGEVTEAHPLGRFKGGATLTARLNTIEVGGKSYSISTSSVARAEKGKGKRTAVMAGGGAALGALIGGLAGGGKGAAIGALAGGGAGTAGAAFTGNKDIILPAESALSFKLKDALELK